MKKFIEVKIIKGFNGKFQFYHGLKFLGTLSRGSKLYLPCSCKSCNELIPGHVGFHDGVYFWVSEDRNCAELLSDLSMGYVESNFVFA